MEKSEDSRPNITFHNQPKLSEDEVDKESNEKRGRLVPFIEDFISTHNRFRQKNIGITFAQEGASSLVSIIESPDEKLVLKVPLSMDHTEGEAQFLKVWEEAGVHVPHVIEDGVLGGHSYILMEHIDAPMLSKASNRKEMIENGAYLKMGHILRLMHAPEAEGYGRIVDGRAEYTKAVDWLFGPDMEKRIEYVAEHKLLGEECGSISIVREILLDHLQRSKSSYCHDDFCASNIFATEPLTIFDPNPRINNGYIDLGRSMLIHLSRKELSAQLTNGYFNKDPYDEQVLHASVFLAATMKLPHWHKKNREKSIKNIQEYLAEKRELLG